jgi:acetylornithine deacetylase
MQRLSSTKDILSKLMACQVIGGDSNLLIADFICSILDEREVQYQTQSNADGTKKLIHAKIGPSVDGGVILSGHTDVVPVKGQDWLNDPFELIEKDEKWFGRGSCDMKGFLACCLSSIDIFKNAPLKRPVYFAFSYDEEVGCLSGYQTAEAIRDFYPEKPTIAIIGEPTMMQPVTGHKGICVIKTSVFGSAGHSSRILKEVSAVHVAAHLIVWLENKMKQLVLAGKTDDSFEPNHSSIHVGKVNGGILANVIADKCEFFWDIRVIPADDIKEILEDYFAFCREMETELQERFPGARIVNEEEHPPVPALNTSENSEALKLAQKISGNFTQSKVSYATEGGQFSETGFDTIVCGPGDIAQAHRANEFVAVDQIKKCLAALDRLAEHLSE